MVDDNSASKPKKKKWVIVIPIILAFIFIGGLTAIFGFNVFNIRDGLIYPPLRVIPIVGNFIPESGELYIEVDGQQVAVQQVVDVSELQAALEEKMAEVEQLRTELNRAEIIQRQYESDIAILRERQGRIDEYEQMRARFEVMIAEGDPNAFAEFFERVYPERAEAIFARIRFQTEADRAFRRYVNALIEMEPRDAGEVVSVFLVTDPELLIRKLRHMNPVQLAEIYSELEPAEAVIIMRLLEPDMEPPVGLLPPIPLIDNVSLPPPPVITIGTPAPAVQPDYEDEEDEDEDADEA